MPNHFQQFPLLDPRNVRGELRRQLLVETGPTWVDAISMAVSSNQYSEAYPFLGATPVMTEWVNKRRISSVNEFNWEVRNKKYSVAVEFNNDDLRRDKTGHIQQVLSDMPQRVTEHWRKLASDKIAAAETSVGYDGAFFFDAAHISPSGASQGNIVDVDISALPTEVHGNTTASPSVSEIQLAVVEGIKGMARLNDDQDEPMNETASSFMVVGPLGLLGQFINGLGNPEAVAESQTNMNLIRQRFDITYEPNVRLDNAGWTDKFAIFRTDSNAGAFIKQSETEPRVMNLAGGQDEFMEDKQYWGIHHWREYEYGLWQHAALVNLI